MSRSKTFCRKRSGVTLIEVLAALALLGSLAVAMILSRGRLVVQHQLAERKIEAVQIADALLATWWSGGVETIPVNESGELPDSKGWTWETRTLSDRSLKAFDAQVLRLRILDMSQPGDPVELTVVDLVLPERGQP